MLDLAQNYLIYLFIQQQIKCKIIYFFKNQQKASSINTVCGLNDYMNKIFIDRIFMVVMGLFFEYDLSNWI